MNEHVPGTAYFIHSAKNKDVTSYLVCRFDEDEGDSPPPQLRRGALGRNGQCIQTQPLQWGAGGELRHPNTAGKTDVPGICAVLLRSYSHQLKRSGYGSNKVTTSFEQNIQKLPNRMVYRAVPRSKFCRISAVCLS